jgi:peptidylprolyl isomerase
MNRKVRAGAAALMLVTFAAGCKADSQEAKNTSQPAAQTAPATQPTTTTEATQSPSASSTVQGPPAQDLSSNKGKSGKVVTTKSGLKYEDLVVGKGPSPKPGQSVTVNYVGTLQDGTKFDSSADHGGTFTFTIGEGQVIKGWDEGVMSMKVGGKRKLTVPPDLAYGPNGMPPVIPPNATLIFTVDLISVQ